MGSLILNQAAAGCASETGPLLREDLDRLRADLIRSQQALQKGQTDLRTEVQQGDTRTAQALTEIQRSVGRLQSRVDEMARDTGQIQGTIHGAAPQLWPTIWGVLRNAFVVGLKSGFAGMPGGGEAKVTPQARRGKR